MFEGTTAVENRPPPAPQKHENSHENSHKEQYKSTLTKPTHPLTHLHTKEWGETDVVVCKYVPVPVLSDLGFQTVSNGPGMSLARLAA